MTPTEAWARLVEGNQRFVTGNPQHPNQDATTRQSLKRAQVPFATLFGCSDSRVAAELIFDVGLGDMFVVRTAGQVTDSATLGSLEYGATVLGTPLMVILGHNGCGAITAAAEAYETGDAPSGFIADVVARLTPAVTRARLRGITDVNGIVEQNVRMAVSQLPERSTAIRQAVNSGRLVIAGVTYHLDVGRANLVASMGNLS